MLCSLEELHTKKYYILQIMYHPVGNLVNETVQTVHNAILGI